MISTSQSQHPINRSSAVVLSAGNKSPAVVLHGTDAADSAHSDGLLSNIIPKQIKSECTEMFDHHTPHHYAHDIHTIHTIHTILYVPKTVPVAAAVA
jgi:hypothetical protein